MSRSLTHSTEHSSCGGPCVFFFIELVQLQNSFFWWVKIEHIMPVIGSFRIFFSDDVCSKTTEGRLLLTLNESHYIYIKGHATPLKTHEGLQFILKK